ncbi:MAG: prolyl oligopeptidase family serine peptidase [Phycisphaerales bacterium]|nr:prolyl oligopeptidase family serine peptidase [Phycisphaerales bacterium]
MPVGVAAPFPDAAAAFVQDGDDAGKDVDAGAKKADGEKKNKDEVLTLKRLFPDRSFFGPSAGGMSFSRDGRYAAWLYRPYVERRHGNDLWLMDTTTGDVRRLTRVSVLAPFQASTRSVAEDRIKKAKKKGAGRGAGATKTPAAAADPVTGRWEGRLHGPEDLQFPPDGMTFTLEMRLRDDGGVSGQLRTSTIDASIDGRFDADAKRITGTISGGESELAAEAVLTIGDDATLTGTITVPVFGVSIDVEGTRVGDLEDDRSTTTDEARKTDAKTDAKDDAKKDDAKTGVDDEKKTGDDAATRTKTDEELSDLVDDKDADDRTSPRYGGVSSFVWAPQDNEFIFTSGGDLYRYEVADDRITRLTRTREPEVAVQYLPDGSGYTYQRGGLIRVTFGSHLAEQIDPDMPDGESVSGYRVSPDGRRMVLLATKGQTNAPGRTIKIVNYRSRFADVREVPRHMSDDPLPDFEYRIYLYEIEDFLAEKGELKRVYAHKYSGPRDVMQMPEWAPDSSRVAFSVFEQTTGTVQIMEARFKDEPEAAADEPDETAADAKADAGEADEEAADDEKKDPPPAKAKKDESKIEAARPVYTFFHNGGPNTPRMIAPVYLPDSRRMAFITEQSGFRHVHVLDPLYENLEPVTSGRFEVYPFGLSEDHRRMFVTATLPEPSQEGVFVVDLETREMTPLSTTPGVYSGVAVSDDGTRALANFVTYGRLRELVSIPPDGEMKTLTDSHPEEAKTLTAATPEFFTYRNRHGHDIRGMMFKPDDWTAADRRPLLIYVYGGPLGTSKMVVDGSYASDAYFFAHYMAKKHGFVTCTVDPRGCSGYGGLFEKSNFEQVGKPQVEDLVDCAKWFTEHGGVDPKRIGLHGWSFGGFQTQMCLYSEPDVFACGMAGAGPTEWENYNSWYSTGTIGTSRVGQTDLAKFSLLPLAKNLKARLLLVHGMEDSNVLYQDTVRVYRELLKAGKEALVELFLDPTGGHGLGGDVKRVNRYRKYEEFLLRCLVNPTPMPESDDPPATEASPEDEPPARSGGRGEGRRRRGGGG